MAALMRLHKQLNNMIIISETLMILSLSYTPLAFIQLFLSYHIHYITCL